MRRAFTLIELLVVITIIVVLLALLTPALDKAIYQAELAVCGSQLKAVANGVTLYAMNNKRTYPDREWTGHVAERAILLNWAGPTAGPYDGRPYIEQVMDINKTLNCPLNEDVPLAGGDAEDAVVFSDYGLWFGFGYMPQKNMQRLGDRLTYGDQRFTVLAGDWDGTFEDRSNDYASHPDDAGNMFPRILLNEPNPLANTTGGVTLSWWWTGENATALRGLLDMNYAFADNSVERYGQVKRVLRGEETDPRMANLPARHNPNTLPTWRVQIPKR